MLQQYKKQSMKHAANMHTTYIQYNSMCMWAYPLNVEHDSVSLYDIKFYVCSSVM